MPGYARSTVIVMTAVWLIAAVSTGAFAERGLGSGNASSRVRLLVQLTGPPPTQQSGGLPGSPSDSSTPGGAAGSAPTRRGTFILTGGVRDRGSAALRLPRLGSGGLESTLVLSSTQGALRVALSGTGTATSGDGDGRWRMTGGSGAYAGASGAGSVSQTPEQAVLLGRLTLRDR
jgi:hypothetical protein